MWSAPPHRPRAEARLAGALYVLVILLGAYAELVGRQGFVVEGDAAATLRAIGAHAAAFRWGFVAETATNLLAVPTTLILLWLLAPAGPKVALVALVLDLTQNTINAANAVTQFTPLFLLPGAPGAAGLAPGQAAALARLSLHLHDAGFHIGLTFFGFALLLEGWLVARSGYFPRWLGALYMLAGACYVAATADFFLASHLPIAPFAQLGSLIGEAAMALWLLVVGLDEPRWREAARRATAAWRSGLGPA